MLFSGISIESSLKANRIIFEIWTLDNFFWRTANSRIHLRTFENILTPWWLLLLVGESIAIFGNPGNFLKPFVDSWETLKNPNKITRIFELYPLEALVTFFLKTVVNTSWTPRVTILGNLLKPNGNFCNLFRNHWDPRGILWKPLKTLWEYLGSHGEPKRDHC